MIIIMMLYPSVFDCVNYAIEYNHNITIQNGPNIHMSLICYSSTLQTPIRVECLIPIIFDMGIKHYFLPTSLFNCHITNHVNKDYLCLIYDVTSKEVF